MMKPDSPCPRLRLSQESRTAARRRLQSIKGHVEGILRMLDEKDTYCIDVLRQLKAVQGALDQVGRIVLRSHLQDHVVSAAQRGDAQHIVDELMEILKYR